MAGTKTTQSLDRLSKSVDENAWASPDQAFNVSTDVSADGINEFGQDYVDSGNNIVAQGLDIADNAVGIYNNAIGMFTDGSQYDAVGDAAGAATIDYIQKKVERIRNAWNTPATIKLGSLIDEVAPYAVDAKTAGKALGKNMKKFISYLSGVPEKEDWDEFGFDALIGEYLAYMATDPSTLEALGNLDAVQAISNGIAIISNGIEIIQEILKICEPLAPTIHIATLVMSSWLNPAAAGEATHTLADIGYQMLFDVYRLSMKLMRNFVYNIEFQVPSLLVGALESLSVKDAVAKYSYDGDSTYASSKPIYDKNGNLLTEGRPKNDIGNRVLGSLFDNDFYENAPMTESWYNGLSQGLSRFQNDAMSLGPAKKFLDDWTSGGTDMLSLKEKILNPIAQGVLTQISANARKAAYVPNLDNMEFNSFEDMLNFLYKDSATAPNSDSSTDPTETPKAEDKIEMMDESPIKNEIDVKRISGLLVDALGI